MDIGGSDIVAKPAVSKTRSMSCTVAYWVIGGIPGLQFWGLSSILSPCEAGLPEKGIVAEGPVNEESVITAEVDTEKLYEIREKGAAPTLKDRRWDLLENLYELESRKCQR